MAPYSSPMTAREVIRRLEQLGATKVRQTGSHARYRSACGKCSASVPIHTGDIPRGTVASIERQMVDCYGKGWLTR